MKCIYHSIIHSKSSFSILSLVRIERHNNNIEEITNEKKKKWKREGLTFHQIREDDGTENVKNEADRRLSTY